MADPEEKSAEWTEYEENLIRDTIIDYREAGKQDQSALLALTKHMQHRNSKQIRAKFREIIKEIDYGGTTITHEVEDGHVVEIISQIDQAISHLESIQDELHKLRACEEDLERILEAIHRVK